MVIQAVQEYPMEVNYKKIALGIAHSMATSNAG
jgi:hypothetical protein